MREKTRRRGVSVKNIALLVYYNVKQMLIPRKLKDEELLCTVANDSSSNINLENVSLVSILWNDSSAKWIPSITINNFTSNRFTVKQIINSYAPSYCLQANDALVLFLKNHISTGEKLRKNYQVP